MHQLHQERQNRQGLTALYLLAPNRSMEHSDAASQAASLCVRDFRSAKAQDSWRANVSDAELMQ